MLSVVTGRRITLTLMTDQQSQQRINEAAEQFTDALVQSYKAVADSGVSAQERNTQVTEVFALIHSITEKGSSPKPSFRYTGFSETQLCPV